MQENTPQDTNTINSTYYTIINSYKELRMKRGVNCVMMMMGLCMYVRAQVGEDGLKQYFHPNGIVSSEGYQINGKPEGWWRTYYETGVLRSEGGRKNFQLDSLWKFYAPNGRIQSETWYKADKKEGTALRYDTAGVRIEEENYINDLREGTAKHFHPNGAPFREVPFLNGKEEGKGIEYAEDGRVVAVLYYGAGMLRKREEINRIDALGLRQGQWKEFHPNGKVRWEGGFVDDRRQGIFKEYDALGNLKELVKYDGGEIDVRAQENLTTEIKRTFHPNGRVASMGGYSKSGKREGLFKEFDLEGGVSSAKIYQGDLLISSGTVNEAGAMEGGWVEYFITGEKRAEGSYSGGKKEGEWTFYHRSGKVEQKGKYLNGLAQGTWQWYYEGGALHREELYRKGKEDGASAEYDEEGRVITQGEYIDGLREGKWTYEVGDHKEEGAYKGGQKDGAWTYTYAGGRKYFTGSFVDGEPAGKHKWYWANGQLKLEGRYAKGFEQGDFTHFDPNGNITLVIKYSDGVEMRVDGTRIPPPFQAGGDQP